MLRVLRCDGRSGEIVDSMLSPDKSTAVLTVWFEAGFCWRVYKGRGGWLWLWMFFSSL